MARKYIAKEVKEIKEQYNYDFRILLKKNTQKKYRKHCRYSKKKSY